MITWDRSAPLLVSDPAATKATMEVFATVLTAVAGGRFDSLPGNHSPCFAPVIEPTLTTGIQTLALAARTWLRA